jgi:Membrane-associated lipoprotein involved in thiamine biosynthesis
MKNIFKKHYGLIISIFIVIAFGIYMCFDMNKVREYSKNLFYMDTYINVKIYSKDPNKAKESLKEIEKIYEEYHELSDRYNTYKGITNIKTINDNQNEILTVDEKLYKLLDFSIEMSKESEGLLNSNIGELVDVWKKYRDKGTGLPTNEELEEVNINISDIELVKPNKITNNGKIDLGSTAKGYATEEVGKYLRKIGLKKYLINAGGNIIVGDHYNNGKYKIALENPDNKNEYFKILNIKNKAIVTSGGYERFYEFEGKKYHHIIDPNTKYPPKFTKSVTVITNDSGKADALSTILFLMSVEDGKEYIKKYKDVDVIWYRNNGKVETTDGIKRYE